MDKEKSIYSNSADVVQIKVTSSQGNCRTFVSLIPTLSKKSKVFLAMLNSRNFKEHSEMVIEINDIPPRTVDQFLNFLNSQELFVSTTNDLMNLLKLADKYMVEDLKEKIQNIMETRINSNNIVELYQAICLHDVPVLKSRCEDFISAFFSAFATSYDFLHLDENTAKSILSLDSLNIATEMEVYDAAYRWSYERCIEKGVCSCEVHLVQEGKGLFTCVRFVDLTEDEKKNVFASVLDMKATTYTKRRKRPKSSVLYSFVDKVLRVDIGSMEGVNELEGEKIDTKFVTPVCLRFIPRKSRIYLVGFCGAFRMGSFNADYIDIRVFCDCTEVKCRKSIYVNPSSTKPNIGAEYKTFILDTPLKLHGDCIYTVRACFSVHSKTLVFTNEDDSLLNTEHLKIFGPKRLLCSIYYISLTQ